MLSCAGARVAAAAVLLVTSACAADGDGDADQGASTDENGDQSSDSNDTQASADTASGGSSAVGCAEDDRDDEYMLGLARAGQQLTVRFVDAMPSPPARFDNVWTIEVLDVMTGAPVDEVSLEVEPFMPDHNHGTSIACQVTDMETPGQLQLDPVNLFMPGLWEVRLHFTLDAGTTDEVVFRFCVDP